MIGSEGTLAFIAEAVLNTVPDLPVKYTGLLLFPGPLRGRGFDCAAAPGGREGAGDHGPRLLALGGNPERHSGFDSHPAAGSRGIAGGVSVGARKRARGAREGRSGSGRRSASCTSRRSSRILPPSKRCCGRFARACFRRSARCARAAPRSSSRTSRFPIEHLADAAHDLTALFRKHDYDDAHHLRPRQGRQPALRHHPELQQSGGRSTSTRASSTTWSSWSSSATTAR